MTTYVVRAGDNLSSIAELYGTTVDALARENNILDPNLIHAGQTLEVPDGTNGAPQPPQEPGFDGGAVTGELFTVEQLIKISQNPDPVLYDLAGDHAALVPEMKKGGIVTKNQITAFLANICQETAWLKTLEEYDDAAGTYLRSKDYYPYYGRGYLQNTWRDAYERLTSALGVDLVANPDLLVKDKSLAARAAVWYWTTNNIGPVADRGDFEGVCSLINRGENPPQGPINGYDERLAAYERAKSVIGVGTEPAITRSEPTAGQITLGYDKEGWAYDTASGLYVKSTADLDHKTNEDGWLWAKVEAATKVTAPTWSWPEASQEPWASGNYAQRHPIRYNWLPERPDVEEWARHLVENYDVTVNTYVDHPEDYWRDKDSFDVWGPGGRDDPLDRAVGDTIWNLLYHYKGKPDIDWIIWCAEIRKRATGYTPEPFGEDDFTWHYDHIHVTYE